MNGQEIKKAMRSEVRGKPFAIVTAIVFLIGGSMLSLIGYGVGAVFALQFGFPAPVEYGGAPGYEGAALFAGMCGSALFMISLIMVWLRGRTVLRWALVAYTILWILVVVVMHYAVIATGSTAFLLIPIPAIVIGIATSASLYVEAGN